MHVFGETLSLCRILSYPIRCFAFQASAVLGKRTLYSATNQRAPITNLRFCPFPTCSQKGNIKSIVLRISVSVPQRIESFHLLRLSPYFHQAQQETKPSTSNYINSVFTDLYIFTPSSENMVQPTTCCGKSGSSESCVCASQAKCSCGKNAALHCDCELSAVENVLQGPRCSCRKFPHRYFSCLAIAALPTWCMKTS